MRRIRELDAIRGLAALAILVHHIWLPEWGILGSAVNLFFVLSGYLITTILLTNEATDRSVIAFYMRRLLRIAPIYYLALAFIVLINPFLPVPESLRELPFYLTYTQNLPAYWGQAEPTFARAFRHTWTLAIEEQFYLLWPALLWGLGRRRLPMLAVSVIGLSVWARLIGVNRWVLAANCDSLALGGLLAGMLLDALPSGDGESVPGRDFRFSVIGCAACLSLVFGFIAPRLTAAYPVPELAHSLRILCINLCYVLVVGFLVLNAGAPRLGWLRTGPLVYLGSISYGIYLYHYIIFVIWSDYAHAWGWAGGTGQRWLQAALSLAVAAASWRYIERPILKLKDRFRYRSVEEGRGEAPELEASRVGGATLR
jgi:peptidoglycan/LPS O-acetylase OafA/YrhL